MLNVCILKDYSLVKTRQQLMHEGAIDDTIDADIPILSSILQQPKLMTALDEQPLSTPSGSKAPKHDENPVNLIPHSKASHAQNQVKHGKSE